MYELSDQNKDLLRALTAMYKLNEQDKDLLRELRKLMEGLLYQGRISKKMALDSIDLFNRLLGEEPKERTAYARPR